MFYKLILSFFVVLCSFSAYASSSNCFIAAENNNIILEQGVCTKRHTPCCSFNIALSLMGYNEGIFIDETRPEFPFKPGYLDNMKRWKQPHNPSLWIKNSCVWYSKVFAEKLGMAKFKEYVTKFKYGNQDVSYDIDKYSGLNGAWLSGGSLAISSEEQVAFLQKIVDRALPVSDKAYEMTRKIIFLGELEGGWQLYGKTGTGNLLYDGGSLNENYHGGWFVGWIEKGKDTIVFASYIQQERQEIAGGGIAKK